MKALADIPLPPGIRSRIVENINGLTMHLLEAGHEVAGGPASCCSTDFRNLRIAGEK